MTTGNLENFRTCFVVEITGQLKRVNVKPLGADGDDPRSRALANEMMSAIVSAIEAGDIGGYALDEFGNLAPHVAGADFEALKEALRHADTATMTTPQVLDFCEAKVPGCTIEEIVRALRQVGDEQLQQAHRLSRDCPDASS
jgi:hypothetical protein